MAAMNWVELENRKVALTLQGGGMKGGAQAVHMERLELERGVPWDARKPFYTILTGDSIGAVNAYLYALGGAAELVRFWFNVKRSDLMKGGGAFEKATTVAGLRQGFWDMTPGLRTIQRLAAGRRIPEGVQVVVSTVDECWGNVTHNVLTSELPAEVCTELVYRSCLVPLAHGARHGRWVDGGVGAAVPIDPAIKAGAEHIHVILLDRAGVDYWVPSKKAIPQAGRAIEILRDQLFWESLLRVATYNEVARLDPHSGLRVITLDFDEIASPLNDWMTLGPEANRLWRESKFVRRPLGEFLAEFRGRRAAAKHSSAMDPRGV
jgi:predicted acylesterase/phospholipase RssA